MSSVFFSCLLVEQLLYKVLGDLRNPLPGTTPKGHLLGQDGLPHFTQGRLVSAFVVVKGQVTAEKLEGHYPCRPDI